MSRSWWRSRVRYRLSYGSRRHAAKAHTCRTTDWERDSPPDRRRRGRVPSRGVAFLLLERHTSRPDGKISECELTDIVSCQIATKCKTPRLRLAQAGRWSRSLGSIGGALLGSASSESGRCTRYCSRARVAPVHIDRAFEQFARDPLVRGDADRRAPARVRLGQARLSRAIELGGEQCSHRSGKRSVNV